MFVSSKGPRLAVEYAEARRLRAEGLPLRAIATSVGASLASVSTWTRDIELTADQRDLNLRNAGAARGDAWRRRHRNLRLRYQEEGRRRARRREPLHLAGCMLYWCEGSKGRNEARLVNSDLALVSFFKRFASECFDLPPERFALSLNVYLGNGLSLADVEDHWLSTLDLPRSCLRGHQLNHRPTSSSGRKRNKLPYGVCHLTIRRGTPIVHHIYGAIQEYAGFDEPGWIDCAYRVRVSRPAARAAPSGRAACSRPGRRPPSARRRGRRQ